MPILNPHQAYNLLSYSNETYDALLPFLKSLLGIASIHLDKNQQTIEIYNQFVDFIGLNIEKIAGFFNIKSQIKKLVNIDNENVYSILSEMIKENENKPKENEETTNNQSYEKIKMNFAGLLNLLSTNDNINIPEDESYFYTPYHDKTFGWYISDKSYAVLTFNFQKHSKKNEEVIFKIRLSTYLIAACGYTLVACLSNDDNYYYHFPSLLKPNFFAETHIFTEIKEKDNAFDPKYFTYQNIGYVYIYAHFETTSDDYRKALENSSNSNVKVFIFSKNVLNGSFKNKSIFYDSKSVTKDNVDFIPDNSDLSAFVKRNLPINFCNVALYEQKDRNTNWVPLKISGIEYGTIEKEYFSFSMERRVEVKIAKKNYYVEYPDIHYMNPELYVAEPMYLAKQNFDISIVEKIKKTYKDKTAIFQKVKVKNSNINANIESKMHNAFHYLHKYTIIDKKNVDPYTSQIYAVYQAITFLGKVENLNYNNNSNFKAKGIVLQVHTGEGKSFIVQALAEHLARQGNIVHIATSNIILAARDYEKAYNYYTNCEKKAQTLISKNQRPSILLHKHELQYIEEFLDNHNADEMPEKELFYGQNSFKNSTNMNICVCVDNDKKRYYSNIIYSTFLNFEAFYLSQNERDPCYIPTYINNCYLIIDEADTILIDELTNGTILSKPMKSNAIEILDYVYKNYKIKKIEDDKYEIIKENYTEEKTNEEVEKIFNWIRSNYKECEDLTKSDVKRMFSDIDKVRSDDFSMGKKYTLDKDPYDPSKSRIVPFDSEHKGIAEPNKEFSGFIHQFIGIKEKTANPEKYKNLIIQPLSLNYLFISHPTYVTKYKGVVGVTGTIGNKDEQELLLTHYGLICQKVPRHQMNMRVDLPKILCNSIQERNEIICKEVEILHKMQYPVLIVFNDVNDLTALEDMIKKNQNIDKTKIRRFDGTNTEENESSKKVLEDESGKPGVITLGTNFCGRGVNIKYSERPLHVIVSYYKKDKRSINQALGRAGRNGHPGTTRIICTKKMFYTGCISLNELAMTNIINEFGVKNRMQLKFMDEMRNLFSWIFEDTETKDKIDKDSAYKIRKCAINVNRITAFNFKFPICMSVRTFLKIQIQRIFSIKNCPECKYSWYLFRIYMRELILESWSLFLDDFDIKFKEYKKENGLDDEKNAEAIIDSYSELFDEKYEEFINILHEFIPIFPETIINTFLHIHNVVVEKWQDDIMQLLVSNELNMESKIIGKSKSYTSIKAGVFPICINEKTGSRLTSSPTDDEKKPKYILITDPELRYIKKGTKDSPFSISKVLDRIFESFQEVVDNKLQNLFGIRFFLRRTLAGCEFGVCIDLQPEHDTKFTNCLIDTDPMFILTLCTKSSYIWMGGILLVVLIFFVSVGVLIATRYLNPKKLSSDLKNLLKFLWKKFIDRSNKEEEEKKTGPLIDIANKVLDEISECLYKMVIKNFDDIVNWDAPDDDCVSHSRNARIFKKILEYLFPIETEKVDEIFADRIFSSLKISDKAKELLDQISPIGKLIKIGLLLIILLAQFIMNFRYKRAIKLADSAKNIASTYQKEDKKYSKKFDIEDMDSFQKAKKFCHKDIKKEYLDIE